jgi:hypothetical protein
MTTTSSMHCPIPLEEADRLGRVGLDSSSCSRVILAVRVDIGDRAELRRLHECLKRPTLRMLSTTFPGGVTSAHTTFAVSTSVKDVIRDVQALAQFGEVKLRGERWTDPAGVATVPTGQRGRKGQYTNRTRRQPQLPSEVRKRLGVILQPKASQSQPTALRPPKVWGNRGEMYT